MTRLLPVVALLSLVACGRPPEVPEAWPRPDCQCVVKAPWYGTAELSARVAPGFTETGAPGDDWAHATFSFEHATGTNDEAVRNDWDLLFGNDREADEDLFTVNMVTDDVSAIVDLGSATLAAIPAPLTLDDYPRGVRGRHDEVPVVLEHLYVVQTRDSDTEQVAAFFVTAHQPNRSVTIRWLRSSAPDHFALDWY